MVILMTTANTKNDQFLGNNFPIESFHAVELEFVRKLSYSVNHLMYVRNCECNTMQPGTNVLVIDTHKDRMNTRKHRIHISNT